MQTNTANASPGEHSSRTLWLVAHERDDPMLLNQTEYADTEAIRALERILTELVRGDIHLDPPFAPEVIGRRYDVHDKDGWLATYWLCEEQVSADDGMLTAIVSPGALQRAHHTVHRT